MMFLLRCSLSLAFFVWTTSAWQQRVSLRCRRPVLLRASTDVDASATPADDDVATAAEAFVAAGTVRIPGDAAGIYVLQLEGARVYVGKSMSNVTTRVLEHFTSGGSAWTKKFQPLTQIQPITKPTEDLESWERAETLERMWQHGIDNVRGWGYTRCH